MDSLKKVIKPYNVKLKNINVYKKEAIMQLINLRINLILIILNL